MAENTVPTTTSDRTPSTREETRYLTPPVDIYEVEGGLTVVADLPGVSKDNMDVRIEDNVLTIQAHSAGEVRGDAIRSEFALRDFHREFHLGDEVDQENISAELKEGVLTLLLPKVERAKPRQIAIKHE